MVAVRINFAGLDSIAHNEIEKVRMTAENHIKIPKQPTIIVMNVPKLPTINHDAA